MSDGGAFVALSSFRDQYVTYDANNPGLATSIYQVGSRVNLSASYEIKLPKHLISTASMYYSGQPGQPYSLVFNGDANGDATTFNDIAFAPATADQVVVTNGTFAQLDAYLSADPSAKNNRGIVPNRNTGTSPWTNQLDVRYAVNVPIGRTKVEVSMSVLNFLNMLNKDWGWHYFPNFYSPQTLGYSGIDAATGKEIINSPRHQRQLPRHLHARRSRSRWQAHGRRGLAPSITVGSESRC